MTVPDRIEVEPEVVEALARIVREATGNAVRHGHAAHIAVDLDDVDLDDRAGLRLRVTDNGCGFDPEAVHGEDAFGLISMRERAEALGAAFRVESASGAGTRIEVAW